MSRHTFHSVSGLPADFVEAWQETACSSEPAGCARCDRDRVQPSVPAGPLGPPAASEGARGRLLLEAARETMLERHFRRLELVVARRDVPRTVRERLKEDLDHYRALDLAISGRRG